MSPSLLDRHAARAGLCAALALSFSLGTGVAVHAEEPVEDEPIERITIIGTRAEKSWLETPASVSVVHEEKIQRAQLQLTLGESIGNLPGVFVQNRSNFSQDARISIRGFGARTPFGIRGIKLIVDGIPLTLPDGQGQVDSLDFSTAERIEVLRGPAASLYGSAAGGVIAITSKLGTVDSYARARANVGSYGFRSYQGQAAGSVDDWSYSIGLSHSELDGYRDHSDAKNDVLLNVKFHVDIDEQTDMTVLVNHVDAPKANDPGGLTAEELKADRRGANPRNIDMKSGEALENTTIGMVLRHAFNEQHETTLTNYYTWRDFNGRIPSTSRGRIDIDRFFLGGSAKHVYTDTIFGFDNRLTTGIEAGEQSDDRQQRAIDRTTGAVGALALSELQTVTTLGAFIQNEVQVVPNVEVSASMRYDWVRFDTSDNFSANGDDSGNRNFKEWSFAGTVLWSPCPIANPFFRIATAFETPTTTSFANPAPDGGGLNPDLDAQTSIHYELGSKGVLADRLHYEASVFYIRVKDELLPYSQNFTTFYENASSSDRIGFELGLKAQLHRDLSAALNYTHSKFEFDKFTDGNDNRFNGKRIPGVPENVVSFEIDYQSVLGPFASFEVQYVDERDADNGNTAKAKDYVVANLRAGYSQDFRDFTLTAFGGVNNLTGQNYIDNLRINDNNARFFEPAAGRNYHGGASVSYHF